MYRRTKFVELLLEIRQEMAHEADYDVDLFAELVRTGESGAHAKRRKKLTNPRSIKERDAVSDPLALSNGKTRR